MEPAGVLLLITFPVGPLLLGLYAWMHCRNRPAATRPDPVPIWPPIWPGALNAALLFALAFNAIYFVQEFFLAWPKALLPGVEATVYHNNHGWKGDHPDLLLYQGAGAVAIVVLGTLLTALGMVGRSRLGGWHPLLWWSACMGLGLGLIQFTIAAMHPDNDVGQAFDHLQLSQLTRFLLALVATLACIGFGVYFIRPLLAMAPEGSVETPGARVIYTLKFAVIPLVVGSLIAWANRAPPLGHLTMPFFSGLFVLPWTVAAAALVSPPASVTDRLHRGVDRTLIVATVLLLLFYRLLLAPGLSV